MHITFLRVPNHSLVVQSSLLVWFDIDVEHSVDLEFQSAREFISLRFHEVEKSDSQNLIIHSFDSSRRITTFWSLSLTLFDHGPRPFNLALQSLALCLELTRFLCNPEFLRVQSQDFRSVFGGIVALQCEFVR